MCKRELRAKVEFRETGSTWKPLNARVYFHPRGCMKAVENHLDIVIDGFPKPLREVLFVSGVRTLCTVVGSILHVDLRYAELRVMGVPMKMRASSFNCYVMKKGRNEVYVSLPRRALF